MEYRVTISVSMLKLDQQTSELLVKREEILCWKTNTFVSARLCKIKIQEKRTSTESSSRKWKVKWNKQELTSTQWKTPPSRRESRGPRRQALGSGIGEAKGKERGWAQNPKNKVVFMWRKKHRGVSIINQIKINEQHENLQR